MTETTIKPNYIYVASSWRNLVQPAVIEVLKAANLNCYDFRNPAEGDTGFHWSQVNPDWEPNNHEGLTTKEAYLESLKHPIAIEGFRKDFQAMEQADTFVLILPCGRSAHLELGWAIGAGKRTAILLDGPKVTPELMYKMTDYIATSVFDLLGWLGVED